MGFWTSYKLRLLRRKWQVRAWRKRRQLRAITDKTAKISAEGILLFVTLRNDKMRLAYFLEYYRKMGVDHFLIVDNDSDDGATEFLAKQPDVSLWHTTASYKASRYGVDWLNWLRRKYGCGHWVLTVDVDEFLIFPFCDTRPLPALTDWLESSAIRSFSAMILDMYPRGRLNEKPYREGDDPFQTAQWFDAGNYTITKNPLMKNLWIQGGVRARMFFADQPENAPALNKIPLVKWRRQYVYTSSAHMLLPRGLNQVYDERGGEKISGLLLHAKFLDVFGDKAAEEIRRNQHYSGSAEYKAYTEKMQDEPELWSEWSERYINWRQLEMLGLMSKGNWA